MRSSTHIHLSIERTGQLASNVRISRSMGDIEPIYTLAEQYLDSWNGEAQWLNAIIS